MATNSRSVIGKWPGVAPLQWHRKCLGATAANGRAQISWLRCDGSAMAQRQNCDRIRLSRHNGSGWPRTRINNKISCLGAMAAQESTIKLIGLGAISTRINIKLVSLGTISARINIKIVSLGAMAAQESNNEISLPWRDGNGWPSARIQPLNQLALAQWHGWPSARIQPRNHWPRRDGNGWPSARIQQKSARLGAMATDGPARGSNP